MAKHPHVVIVGAGFGGLAAARALRHVEVDVTMVDRNNYHLFQPLLYQVASGLLDPSAIASPVRTIVRRARNVDVLRAEVTGVDLDHRRVTTSAVGLDYDYLVIASGSVTDYFGNEDARKQSVGLKDLGEALALRSRLLGCFEQASLTTDAATRRRLLTFAVVGAGPTGVEYSGAVAELINHVLPKDYRRVDFAEVSVVLIEAGERVLASFAPRLSRLAARSLQRKGVRIVLGEAVRDVDDRGLVLQGGQRIEASTVVWTAGVRAAPPLDLGGDALARGGRIRVTPSLHLSSHPEVFVIGDATAVEQAGAVLPMLAPVAIQGGKYVGRAIAARIMGKEIPAFRYRDKGTMATVGRGAAVAQIGPLHINGLVGWFLWVFVHLLYLVGFRSRALALVSWAWNYFFWDRPVRLIVAAPDDE
jgi:NADH:ubiquinone reductase (H+-translocating)